MSDSARRPGVRGFLTSRSGIVLLAFLAVAGYFLWAEHRAHLIASLPWLLLGGYVLMHLFMHHGHSRHGGKGGSVDDAGNGGRGAP